MILWKNFIFSAISNFDYTGSEKQKMIKNDKKEHFCESNV